MGGLHPSFKRAEKLTSSRSVMKRSERIKWLKSNDRWNEKDGVLGLPKIKVMKLKAAKKEKKEEKPAEAGAVPAAGAVAPAAGAKPGAPAAPAAKKEAPKSK